ncbi:MAG TPA: ATP-binding protein [Anaerolineales bacterium]|nr:ATP-binding protein [Anaerolineales bacterium]
MDEKTIPLKRYMEGRSRLPDKPTHQWGDNVHYRALFEQMRESVFIIGMDFRYLAANQQALDLLGYTEAELIGISVGDVMSLDESLARDSAGDDHPKLFERALKRKDGTSLTVEISTTIVNDEQGAPAYIQSIVRDISERKQAEEVLRRHALILSVISDATARLMRTSNIEDKIPEVLKSLGQAIDVSCCAVFEINTFSAEPRINIQYQWNKVSSPASGISSLIRPILAELIDMQAGLFSSGDREDENGVSFLSYAILPLQESTGSRVFLGLFDFEKTVSWSSSDRDAIQTAATLIDAALQRNWYEETIRLSEARNRTMIDAFPDLLIRIDLQGIILDYSTNPDHPLYIHRDVIAGKKFSETWPPEVVENILGSENVQGFVAPRRVEGIRLPYSSSTYESRLHPIGPGEALIVIRDITEQARLDEMKSDFINRASHELRTPLTSAILMTELIQGGGSPEELKEYWRTLNSELNRQKILIDRLLIAGRLESGMMNLERVPTELVSILQESMRAVGSIAGKRKVSLTLSRRDPILILGDKSGLQQVFINLINNAAKFSPEGSAVRIDVEHAQGRVSVSISDKGIGIPPEALPHLFERFYRAKNVTIAEIPGSGIGLYIVKSIVEELGGSIHVKSAINQGTTFIVTLIPAS